MGAMSKSNPLERALMLLDIVASANREMPLVEIATSSGLPQSTVFRLTANLVESGMLSYSPHSKTYTIGSRTLRLSLMATGHRRIEEMLGPVLEVLSRASGETSFFVLRSSDGNRLLRYLVPEIGARAFIHPGFSFPMHATAAGKVIAAFSRQKLELKSNGDELEKFQPATITDPTQLKALFQSVRDQGYAVNESELDKDVYSVCAPVFFAREVAGALGFVGPRERLLDEGTGKIAGLTNQLLAEARNLSRLLTS